MHASSMRALAVVLVVIVVEATVKVRPFEVHIGSGKIRGQYITHLTHVNNEYTVFKGIPYARPPVGTYRFRVRSHALYPLDGYCSARSNRSRGRA